MTWGNLSGIWLVGAICLFGIVAILLDLRRAKLHKQLAAYNDSGWTGRHRNWCHSALWILGMLFLAIAYLRPQWGEVELSMPQQGREIVLAVDVSRSMLAEDLKPSRLEFTKSKIQKLLQMLGHDRVGLVLFSTDAVAVCPLTRDRDILLNFLTDVSTNSISTGSTNLTRAIEVGVKLLNQTESAKTKLLIIFTDGEDFSKGLNAAGDKAKTAGVQIFTFGVGTTTGAPVPKLNLQGESEGFMKDQSGNIVISRLNQLLLQSVANQCGGEMVISSMDDHDLHQVKKWVEKFEMEYLGERTIGSKAEQYYWFAGLGLLLLIIEWLL